MKIAVRIAVTVISGVATLYFVSLAGGALLLSSNVSYWISLLGSLLAAACVARYVWRHTASSQAGLVGSVLLGALVAGGIGFSVGFFGPLLFSPRGGANMGPMLGLFITGPLGIIVGAGWGVAHWCARSGRPGGTSNWPKSAAD